MFRKNGMGRRGGGVLLYMKDNIPAYEVQLQEDLTRFNTIVIKARAQMTADKEAVGLQRVHMNLSESCPHEILVYYVLKHSNTARMNTISRQFIPLIYRPLGKKNTF